MATKRKIKKTTAPRRSPKKSSPADAKTSKQDRLIEMLRRPEGAAINEIAKEFGWQLHTVRGTLSGALKKRLGLKVTSTKADGARRYHLPAQASRDA